MVESIVNETADKICGIICCLCFMLGTCGNIASFFYFKSKKREMSSVIYMLITANDVIISLAVLPAGISLMTNRQPGIIFGSKYGCEAWIDVWLIAAPLSVFLVLCLSSTRTVSLLRPFKQQKIKYLVISIALYLILLLCRLLITHLLDDINADFVPHLSRCDLDISTNNDKGIQMLLIGYNIIFTAPAFAVAISCVISVVVLTRKNKNVQQRELQQSRNRATITILLFALLYGVCNIPLVLEFILMTHGVGSGNWTVYIDFTRMSDFTFFIYYSIVIRTLLIAFNSAVNPIFYYWRMPPLREYMMVGIGKVMRPCTCRKLVKPQDNDENTNVDDVGTVC